MSRHFLLKGHVIMIPNKALLPSIPRKEQMR